MREDIDLVSIFTGRHKFKPPNREPLLGTSASLCALTNTPPTPDQPPNEARTPDLFVNGGSGVKWEWNRVADVKVDGLQGKHSVTPLSYTPLSNKESQSQRSVPSGPPSNTFRLIEPPKRNRAALETETAKEPRKRARLHIDLQILPESVAVTNEFFSSGLPVTSPLFFSNRPKRQPPLWMAKSGSEAADDMLNKTREESSGVTTLKLARGSINTASPPRAASTSGSWFSQARNSPLTTPESGISPVLENIGAIELLEQDDRPVFVIDLGNTANYIPGPLKILYANPVLKAFGQILEMITGSPDLESADVAVSDFPEFKNWALSYVDHSSNESMDISLPTFVFGGITWTCSTLRRRMRVIKGNSNALQARIGSASNSASNSMSNAVYGRKNVGSPLKDYTEAPDYFGDALTQSNLERSTVISTGITESPLHQAQVDEPAHTSPTSHQYPMKKRPSYSASCFDWTRIPLSPTLPRHVQFARSIDWASTSLGPIESWSYDLRAMCNLVMGSPHPAAMYWGDDNVIIYNEAYVLLAGEKHPKLMGQCYSKAWSEIWDEIEPVFRSAKESGEATMKDDDMLFLVRGQHPEESYFSWSIVPLIGEQGTVVGLYNPTFEKTRRKIAERRMLTLREIGQATASAREIKSFWSSALKGLEYNTYDVPFCYMYSVNDENDSDLSSIHSGSLAASPQVHLEGTLGVPADHSSVTSSLDLKTSERSWAPYLRQAMKTAEPVVLSTDDVKISSMTNDLRHRGFGDPCRAVVVVPIHPTTGETILGFLVLGINPRRPYDDDYSLFIVLLSRQLATTMASVVLFEEEIRRGQRAARLAAQDRIELAKQLDLRTREVVESETRFSQMAQFAPVGMFIANSKGTITYSNDSWWEITRHPKESNADTWIDAVMDDDRADFVNVWQKLVVKKQQVTHEFRVKAPWRDRNGIVGDTWVLMNAYAETDGDLHLKSIFGCLTNISQQKWAEGFQKRKMQEAVELKRQQENFIDITSHEMRNPLSAILQCADEITTTLSDYRKRGENMTADVCEVLDNSVDAAQTIALCAQHQKRIVDDILTLSKLDSALLLVTPVDIQPVAVVQRALKMFEGELDTNDIKLEFEVEPSYDELKIDWVKLDPSRLLQVLINLTTNAIKFSTLEYDKTITVSIGASIERPSDISASLKPGSMGVSYFPSRSKREAVTTTEDWGSGEQVYLSFAVQDTGRGLDESEKMLLFQRFSQASPRTHVQYGGSGLGLFISRELTELQGGEIGVASKRGVGSTFAFYVKSRRAETPANNIGYVPAMLRKNSNSRTNTGRKDGRQGSVIGKHSHRLAQPLHHEKPAAVARSSSSEHGPLKVLIVEDNLVNQRVLQKQLNNLGCITHVANQGEEALEILRTSRYWKGNEKDGIELDVILMDLEMPVMDGLTCARRIRELESEGMVVRHVPIIAVTANARLEQIQTAVSAGMDDVVSKPFRIPELISKIEELVQKERNQNPFVNVSAPSVQSTTER